MKIKKQLLNFIVLSISMPLEFGQDGNQSSLNQNKFNFTIYIDLQTENNMKIKLN